MPRKKSAPVKRSLPSATGGDQPAASRKIFVVEEKGDYVLLLPKEKEELWKISTMLSSMS